MPPLAEAVGGPVGQRPRHALSRDLSLLYRLALDMAAATTYEELCRLVLDSLLEAIPAEVGAVLTTAAEPFKEEGVTTIERPGAKSQRGADLEVTAHRHRDLNIRAMRRFRICQQ